MTRAGKGLLVYKLEAIEVNVNVELPGFRPDDVDGGGLLVDLLDGAGAVHDGINGLAGLDPLTDFLAPGLILGFGVSLDADVPEVFGLLLHLLGDFETFHRLVVLGDETSAARDMTRLRYEGEVRPVMFAIVVEGCAGRSGAFGGPILVSVGLAVGPVLTVGTNVLGISGLAADRVGISYLLGYG